MSSKFYIGLGLLVFLLIFGLFVGFFVQKQQQSVKNIVIAAQDAADLREGVRLISQAQERWRQGWKGIASVSHHVTMEEIDRIFAQLSVCSDDKEFLLRSAELCSLLDALTNDHIFTWWNLL